MNKYTYARLSVMIHKTLTVSEEAYNALARRPALSYSHSAKTGHYKRSPVPGNRLSYMQSNMFESSTST